MSIQRDRIRKANVHNWLAVVTIQEKNRIIVYPKTRINCFYIIDTNVLAELNINLAFRNRYEQLFFHL